MVSLRLYEELLPLLSQKEVDLGQTIPRDWYSFNSAYGDPVRIRKTIRGDSVPWAAKDCPWFFSNKFQGYYQ